MISPPSASTSTTTPSINARTIRFFNRASLSRWFQTVSSRQPDLKLFFRGRRDLASLPLLLHPQFNFLDCLQRLVPPTLQFVRYQAVLRIGRIILFGSTVCSILRCLPVPLQRLQNVVLPQTFLFTRQHSSFYCDRLHDAQYLLGDGLIQRQATERDAGPVSVIQPTSMTYVPQHERAVARIADHQLATATATS
jgi:hypothetical protein